MSAPADAFVVVAQFLARWRTPLVNVAVGQPVWPGPKTPGTRGAAAVPTSPSVRTSAAAVMSRFIGISFFVSLGEMPDTSRNHLLPCKRSVSALCHTVRAGLGRSAAALGRAVCSEYGVRPASVRG